MTDDLLSGLRVIEISAFVAAPLAGLTLAQLGAEVIRIDPPGGGIDNNRWPLANDGSSLYWQGLNRGKKSVQLNLREANGREVFHRLLNTRDQNGGIVLTNLGGADWLQFEALKQQRPDVILIELCGHHDGAPAVDYTVNAAVGVPLATGTAGQTEPVNHMLPAWDGMAGLTLSTALLAALRSRDQTSAPRHLRIALSDVAVGFLGNLGILADTHLKRESRPRHGNHVYGTFGHSLRCKDGKFVMVVAMTKRHWQALVTAAHIEDEVQVLEQQGQLDLNKEEDRYSARNDIVTLLQSWSEQLPQPQVAEQLQQHGALWGPYQSFEELLNDKRLFTGNPLIQQIPHAYADNVPVPGSTIRDVGGRQPALTAGPEPGSDTQNILNELDLPQHLLDELNKIEH